MYSKVQEMKLGSHPTRDWAGAGHAHNPKGHRSNRTTGNRNNIVLPGSRVLQTEQIRLTTLFAQNRPIFEPCEFTRNRRKQSYKELKISLGGFWNRFSEFGAISRTCQNRPCSKPWAIAQAFCSKSANFRALQIHPKSTETVVQVVKNQFRRVLEPFQ